MKSHCPATALFKHFKHKFGKTLSRIDSEKKSICSRSKLKGTPFCPVSYFKGKIAEKTFHRLEKDEKYNEEFSRGLVKNISILFADIRGFTKRTANMPPHRIVTLLDLFVPEMFNIIINRHKGMVDKLLGDGIMALYGHPYQTDKEIVQAIYSAIDMQQATAALDEILKISGHESIEIGVGINYGEVLICEVGDERYRESTVIGAPVNLAAKMEDIAGANEIALPQESLRVVEKVKPKMIPYFEYRGTSNNVEVAVFNWQDYLEKEQKEFADWEIQ